MPLRGASPKGLVMGSIPAADDIQGFDLICLLKSGIICSINKNLTARNYLNQHKMLFLLFRFSLAGGIIKPQ